MKKGYLTLLNISDKEILERYAKGKESLASISKDAGCYPCTIRDRIKSYNKYLKIMRMILFQLVGHIITI